jgi:hypothetical protein
MPAPENKAAFHMSRIYAEGWNAARRLLPDGTIVSNPYRTEPERARWDQGFAEAAG